MRILLVEDEPDLGEALAKRLADAGFVVDRFANLASSVQAVLSADYRAVLLDRRLPDGDGLSLIPILRTKTPSPPVIVISALNDIPDRVQGIEAGAEDYLIKPFAFEELIARLRSLLRRAGNLDITPEVTLGRLKLDLARQEVTIGDQTIVLPRRDLAIIDALIRRAGRVVMREHLHEQVYGFDDEVSPNALEVQISRLRKKLSESGAAVEIHGIRGIGYIMKALP